jgi:hypothetical protein
VGIMCRILLIWGEGGEGMRNVSTAKVEVNA